MGGIVAYGTYVPYWRLDRKQITETLGIAAGPGTRAVASFDEDTTSMAVEAARVCLAAAPKDLTPGALMFATTAPAYLDKTNANAIHAALALPQQVPAWDMLGAVRSGVGVMRLAGLASMPALAVLSDTRSGLAGGSDEAAGGDAAAAFLFAPTGAADGDVVAEVAGTAHATAEFLDRWRLPGDEHSRVWEERFGEAVYVPLAIQAFADACKDAQITPTEIDHVVVAGVHARAARVVTKSLGTSPEAAVDDLTSVIGNSGVAAHAVVLAAVLDKAAPEAVIAVVSLADGADVTILRTTPALSAFRDSRQTSSVGDQIAAGRGELSYISFLTWRGHLRREPPRRPDPEAPAAPPSYRHDPWKFAFTASRCEECGSRHLPPARVCLNCDAVDRMRPERLADAKATVTTFTIDNLAYTPSPPLVAAVIDFDGGGRFRCEITDCDPAAVHVGMRVEMTFRRIQTAKGVHNYFWKARRAGEEA